MYHYALYGYLAYKAYEYSNVLEYAFSIGKGIYHAYRWVRPTEKETEDSSPAEDSPYLDWVLVTED